jgi:hypothetical protein
MRVKLLAIGILAVLLCAMMPMAVSAAPTIQGTPAQNVFATPVHWFNQPQKPLVGQMVIGKTSYVLVCTHLAPNSQYEVCAAWPIPNGWVAGGFAGVHTNACGNVIVWGTFRSPNDLLLINDALALGGGVFVLGPL